MKAKAFWAALVLGAPLSAHAQQASPDVGVTGALPPAASQACGLQSLTPDATNAIASPADMKRLTGCEVTKLSSFQLLGQTTEIYEVRDGSQRLQITLQNSRVISRSLRKL